MLKVLILNIFVLISLKAFSASAPFQLLDNRVITPIFINNQGPFYVMFDTGATNILSNEVAARLNIPRYDSFPITGGGQNTVPAAYCDLPQWKLAEVSFSGSRISGSKGSCHFKLKLLEVL